MGIGDIVSSMAGGVLDHFLDRRESRHAAQDARQFASDLHADSSAQQREFAQMGIRWRVADAQAAGLHPLYALGGSGAAFSPSSVSVGGGGVPPSSIGQNLSRAVAAQETPEERSLRLAQLRTLEASAERDFAQASYYRSEAMRRSQPAASPMPSDVVVNAVRGPGKIEEHPLYSDAVRLTPDEMVSRSVTTQGQTSGVDHPSVREFVMPGDFRILLPATSGGGIPEDIEWSMIPFVIGANVEKYGWRWLVDALGYVTGRSPEARDRLPNLERWLRNNGGFWRK